MKSWVDANRTTTGNHQMMLVHDGYPASGHSVAYSRLGSVPPARAFLKQSSEQTDGPVAPLVQLCLA